MGNEPIYPIPASIGHEDRGGKGIYYNFEGLTKREHFAGLVMAELLKASGIADVKAEKETLCIEWAASVSLRAADALIKELNK